MYRKYKWNIEASWRVYNHYLTVLDSENAGSILSTDWRIYNHSTVLNFANAGSILSTLRHLQEKIMLKMRENEKIGLKINNKIRVKQFCKINVGK